RTYPHSLIRLLHPPTQDSPFRSKSPAAGIHNSQLIHTNIYLGASPHQGVDVSACMTNTPEV
uniref:Uncharacterized protein n=1 Tax=Mesocestoides corti TaxID=53468 RepID=A0A5K3F187_MESCO